jgi:hypothetical protein
VTPTLTATLSSLLTTYLLISNIDVSIPPDNYEEKFYLKGGGMAEWRNEKRICLLALQDLS